MNFAKWFRGLRGRLAAIMFVSVLCMSTLIYVGYNGNMAISKGLHSITDVRMPSIRGLEEMNEGQTAVLQVMGLIHHAENPSELDNYFKRYYEKRKQITTGFKIYEPLPQSPDEEAEYNNTFTKVWKTWEESADKYIDAYKRKNQKEMEEAYSQFEAAFGPAEAS